MWHSTECNEMLKVWKWSSATTTYGNHNWIELREIHSKLIHKNVNSVLFVFQTRNGVTSTPPLHDDDLHLGISISHKNTEHLLSKASNQFNHIETNGDGGGDPRLYQNNEKNVCCGTQRRSNIHLRQTTWYVDSIY